MSDRLVHELGAELAGNLTGAQRDQVLAALEESETGVRRLVVKILADARVANPIAVLLYRLGKGAHRLELAPGRRRAAEGSKLDAAEAAYRSRLAAYPHLGERDALEYAVDYTTKPGALAGPDFEQALCERLGQEWQPPAPNPAGRHLTLVPDDTF